jgi:hypothetical protein
MRKRGRVITKVYACMCLVVATGEHVHAHNPLPFSHSFISSSVFPSGLFLAI